MQPNGLLESLVRLTHGLLRRHSSAALEPFMVHWPQGVAPTRAPEPVPRVPGATAPDALPVLRFLPDIAAAEGQPGWALVDAVRSHGHALAWRQTHTAAELGPEFLRNYAYTDLIGLAAPVASRGLACGFLLLGPGTLYPSHRHEAEEIYLPLSGDAEWLQGDARWRTWPPDSVIHHRSEEPHAMRTGPRPLLALYLWRSADLRQKARLGAATKVPGSVA